MVGRIRPLLILFLSAWLESSDAYSVGVGVPASLDSRTPGASFLSRHSSVAGSRVGKRGAASAVDCSMSGQVDFSAPLRGIPVSRSATVEADVEFCYEIAADFGQTLNWAKKNGMQEVKVLDKHEDGRGKRVQFRAKPPLGPYLDNVLVYKYDVPNTIAFRSLSGNVMKTLDGAYTFSKQGSNTVISYEIAVQFPGVGVPDMIQKQITGVIAQTAVFELKEYIKSRVPRKFK